MGVQLGLVMRTDLHEAVDEVVMLVSRILCFRFLRTHDRWWWWSVRVVVPRVRSTGTSVPEVVSSFVCPRVVISSYRG